MEFLQPICKEIFERKYMINGEKDVDEVFKGVAEEISKLEKDKEKWKNIFYEELSSGRLIPGGRILANARPNTKMQYYSNCYTIDIEDSIENIYESLKEDALISQSGGGVGFNVSKLRPEGSPVSKGGTASGPISFLKVFDQSAKIVQTSGQRRSAHIALLDISHPDIEAFITTKHGDLNKELTHFNISVIITDEFIKAVKEDKDWNLIFNGKIYKTIKAKYLYDLLTKHAFTHNEPGTFFIDTVNKYNNGYYAINICAVNPCGEVCMPAYNLCCIGSVNYTAFVKNAFTKNAEFDFDSYERSIAIATRFLDNVLDITKYPLKKIKDNSLQWRRIGVGFTGLANTLAMLGIKYGSEESKKLSDKLAKKLRDTSYLTSSELAKEKGSFPAFNKDKLLESNFIKKLPEKIIKSIKDNGLRNIGLMAVAPTGTISFSLGNNCSSGIEPTFSLEYYRTIRTNNKEETKKELVQDYAWLLFNKMKNTLSSEEQKNIKNCFVTSADIKPRDAIDIQAIFQEYIDHSISKTLNLPKDCTYEEYKDLFLYAHSKGLKGVTSYNPNGSLKGILEDKNTTITRPSEIIQTHAPKRPEVLEAHIHQTTIKTCKWIFLVGLLKGKPYEIMGGKEECINIPKKYIKGNETKNAWIVKVKKGNKSSKYNLIVGSLDKNHEDYQCFENISSIFPAELGTPTRLISSNLRHGMPIQHLIEQLGKIPQEDNMFTFESGVRRVLKFYISDGVEIKDECPECNSKMIFENGCIKCNNCGYSKCS